MERGEDEGGAGGEEEGGKRVSHVFVQTCSRSRDGCSESHGVWNLECLGDGLQRLLQIAHWLYSMRHASILANGKRKEDRTIIANGKRMHGSTLQAEEFVSKFTKVAYLQARIDIQRFIQ